MPVEVSNRWSDVLQTLRKQYWVDANRCERLRLLRLLCCLQLFPAPPGSRPQRAALVQALSVLLHETESRCRRFLRENRRHLCLLEERRNRWRGAEEIRRYNAAVELEQAVDSDAFLRALPGSVLFASYHLGDYVHSLNRVIAVQPPERPCRLIRLEPESRASRHNRLQACRQSGRKPTEMLLADETDWLRLRRQLRGQASSLFSFCDLSSRFGASVQVEFLSRPAWFVKGPASLAIAASLPVIPVLSWHDGKQNRLRLARPIDSRLLPGESFDAACQRITQQLVRHLEQQLRQRPGQWRYLSALPVYFMANQGGF